MLAVDLGQSIDPTALAVLQHTHTKRFNMSGYHTRGSIHAEPRIEWQRETFDVRHLQRLPLGLSYIEVIGEVKRLLARPPLADGCELVIDETGVGRPVGDLFDVAGCAPTRVSITAGNAVSRAGNRRWHVPKGILISMLDARLHTGELRFAADLAASSAMAEELKDFRRKVSAAGRFSYEARVGQHDDLVLAVAIGLWTIVGRPKPAPMAFGIQTWA